MLHSNVATSKTRAGRLAKTCQDDTTVKPEQISCNDTCMRVRSSTLAAKSAVFVSDHWIQQHLNTVWSRSSPFIYTLSQNRPSPDRLVTLVILLEKHENHVTCSGTLYVHPQHHKLETKNSNNRTRKQEQRQKGNTIVRRHSWKAPRRA